MSMHAVYQTTDLVLLKSTQASRETFAEAGAQPGITRPRVSDAYDAMLNAYPAKVLLPTVVAAQQLQALEIQ